jgi:hypothetical protein
MKSRKKHVSKKTLVIAAAALIVIALGAWLALKYAKPAPKQVYSVAVMVRSQVNDDPAEDRRTSLKAGDALVVQPENHSWSYTESISYLILKMSLTEEQARKLTQPKEREIDEDELSEEEQQRIEEEKKLAKEEDREYVPEPRRETLIAREYYIDLSKDEFEGLNPDTLSDGNPFQDVVFDWGVVERKRD